MINAAVISGTAFFAGEALTAAKTVHVAPGPVTFHPTPPRKPLPDLDLTVILFFALLATLILVAIGAAVAAVAAARSQAANARTAPVAAPDARALVLRRGDIVAVASADMVAAAGSGPGIVLGSGAKADVRIEGLSLADRQARLTRDGGRLFLTNLGVVGDVAIAEVPLPSNRPWPMHAGDRVRLGKTEFTVEID